MSTNTNTTANIVAILNAAKSYTVDLNDCSSEVDLSECWFIVDQVTANRLMNIFDEEEFSYRVTGGEGDAVEITLEDQAELVTELVEQLRSNADPLAIVNVTTMSDEGDCNTSIAFNDDPEDSSEVFIVHPIYGNIIRMIGDITPAGQKLLDHYPFRQVDNGYNTCYEMPGGAEEFKDIAKFLTENVDLKDIVTQKSNVCEKHVRWSEL